MTKLKAPKTFEEFEKIQSEYNRTVGNFKLLGIDLNFGAFGEIGFNWYKSEYIKEAVGKLDFFDELTFKEKIELAMCCEQESRNNFLMKSEVKEVNEFFNLDITVDSICKTGNRFI